MLLFSKDGYKANCPDQEEIQSYSADLTREGKTEAVQTGMHVSWLSIFCSLYGVILKQMNLNFNKNSCLVLKMQSVLYA
jgi:hypothetical protein